MVVIIVWRYDSGRVRDYSVVIRDYSVVIRGIIVW